MFKKLKNSSSDRRLSMRAKLSLAFGAIVVVLVMSVVISYMEYRRMSSYVSGMIADDIRNIYLAQGLVNAVDEYNLSVLAVIGDDKLSSVPEFDRRGFIAYCDSLKAGFSQGSVAPMADSVMYAYSAYMLASLELEDVYESSFIDTRDWYFNRLQPLFGRLRAYLDRLSDEIYGELRLNSRNFDSGFYRSIIPGAVAVLAGIVLILLLLFYLHVYYVSPLYRMLSSLKDYLKYRHRYNYSFEGNDQLSDLNSGISDLAEENRQLRRRLSELKDKLEK